MTRQILIGFRDVFEGEEMLDPKSYLKGISRKTLIDVATYLLANAPLTVEGYCRLCLGESNSDFARLLVNFLSTRSGRFKADEYVVVSVTTGLKLYELAVETSEADSDTLTHGQIEIAITKTVLAINQTEIDAQDKLSVGSDDEKPIAPKMMLAAMSPYHSTINCSLIDELVAQTHNALCLFKFLEQNYSALLTEFLKTKGITHWHSYISGLYGYVYPILKHLKSGYSTIVTFKSDDEYSSNLQFIESLSHQSIDSHYDFQPLRARPFYFDRERREIRPILSVFVIDMLFKGLYFQLKDINERLGIIPDLKSTIGTDFTEQVLFNSVMKSIFGRRFLQRTESQMVDTERQDYGNPDFYVRNGNKVYIFEIKDALIRADVLNSYDYNEIEKELKFKLFQNKKGTPKGIRQLINNIKGLFSGYYEWDKGAKVNKIRIHPVLVFTDRSLTLPAANVVLNEWFYDQLKEEISEDELTRVAPLVTVSLNSLFIHSQYLSIGNNFESALKSFYPRFNIKQYLANVRSLETAQRKYMEECMMSFDMYLNLINPMSIMDKWNIIKPELTIFMSIE